MKVRARTSVVSTVTASLALALVGPAVAAHASAETSSAVTGAALARFPEFAGLTDSRSLTDPLMLQGTLTDGGGNALAGAQVLLSAWPSNDAVAKLPVGGSFDLVPVARTIARKDGSYQLRSLITPLLMSLTGTDGLDVELDVFHSGRHYVYLTQLRTAGGWVHDFVRGVDGQAAELTSHAPNALDLAFDPAQGEKLSKTIGQGSQLQAADHPIPGGPGCTSYHVFAITTAWTTAATAVMRNRASGSVVFNKGATVSSSTGFSLTGAGEFSISGARSRTSNGGVRYDTYAAKKKQTIARDYRVEIKHQTLERECVGNKYGEYRHQYMTNPVELTGGFTDVPSRYGAWNCTLNDGKTTLAHGRVWTESAKAATYEKAFDLFPFDGASFTGRALSGYSENVQITYDFVDSHRGQWCGHTGMPFAAGQRVQGFEV